ncbi:MAG TPA: response regulator [Candidatus Limnocylindria bacterium]|nr:response regulator [Candidatus Limnocylindria bacterium]
MLPRVLVVEDDLPTLRMIELALSDSGYTIATARDGDLAIGECLVTDPDVIVLDLRLPRRDGRQFLHWYRRHSGKAKVVVVSGASENDPLVQGLVADDFIDKPFDVDRLSRSVERLASH